MLIRKFLCVGAPSGAAQPRLESVRGLAVIVLILGIALIDADLAQLPPRCLSLRLDRERGAENTSYLTLGEKSYASRNRHTRFCFYNRRTRHYLPRLSDRLSEPSHWLVCER